MCLAARDKANLGEVVPNDKYTRQLKQLLDLERQNIAPNDQRPMNGANTGEIVGLNTLLHRNTCILFDEHIPIYHQSLTIGSYAFIELFNHQHGFRPEIAGEYKFILVEINRTPFVTEETTIKIPLPVSPLIK